MRDKKISSNSGQVNINLAFSLSVSHIISLQDSEEDSALVWAVDKDNGEVVDLLLERRELAVLTPSARP